MAQRNCKKTEQQHTESIKPFLTPNLYFYRQIYLIDLQAYWTQSNYIKDIQLPIFSTTMYLIKSSLVRPRQILVNLEIVLYI